MTPQWTRNIEAICPCPLITLFQIIDAAYDEPEVVKRLRRAIACWALMYGKIIAPRTQVNIVRIGLPNDLHRERTLVKVDRFGHVLNVECNMSESTVFNHPGLPLPSRM
jgi:hypothetical protein